MLASPETATDGNYAAILGVIGHEVCKLCTSIVVELFVNAMISSYYSLYEINLHVCMCSIFTTGQETGWLIHVIQISILLLSFYLIVTFFQLNNRVTCRDWFQLSLKEGLTVFRDQVRHILRLCAL